MQERIQEFVQEGHKFFYVQGGLSTCWGLKLIYFTGGGGGLTPIAPPEYTSDYMVFNILKVEIKIKGKFT